MSKYNFRSYPLLGLLALVGVFSLASVCQAATKTYVGPSGGVWEDPSNWLPSGVPTSADDVFVTSTSNPITVTVSAGQTINFNNLTIGTSTLILNGDIGTGANISITNWGSLVQGTSDLQKISGNLSIISATNTPALTHTPLSATSGTPYVNFEANNITIGASTLVDVEGRGYPGGSLNQNGAGPLFGTGDAAGGGGAASCGNGGNGVVGAGNFSGQSPALFPQTFDFGSGGGGDATLIGGAGGGKVKLFARNTFTQNGIIKANALGVSAGDVAGGGSGGSIWLLAKNFISTSGAQAAAGGQGDVISGGGGGGCIRLDYFVSSTRGEMTPNPSFFVNGAFFGAHSGTDGATRIFKGPSPVSNFAVATGSPVYTSTQLTWNWGGGDFDWFYNIQKSLDGMDYSALNTSTANTTTLSFTDVNLLPATRYWYRIGTVSSTVPSFVSVSGTAVSEASTLSLYQYADHVILPQPLSATFGTLAPTSLPVTLNYGLNPATTPMLVSDNSGFYYTGGGVRNGTSPAYINVSDWQGNLPGLTASTSYTFTFTPYVLVDTSTYYAATTSLVFSTTTPLAAPGAPTFMGESSTTLNLAWTTNGNPTTTPYAIYNVTLDKYHTAAGAVSATPVFFPASSWNGAVKGLNPASTYYFKVVMRNEDGTQNVTTSAAGSITLGADNLAASSGGSSSGGGTTSTGSGSGWYFGTPGNVTATLTYSNLPTSTVVQGTTPSNYSTGISSDLMSAYINGVLITPQMAFQMQNSTPSTGTGYYTATTWFLPKNSNSNITFLHLPAAGTIITAPKNLSLAYSYRNLGASKTVFVERVLISPQNKVVSRSTTSRLVGSKKTTTFAPVLSLSSKLIKMEAYTVRIRVYTANGKTVLDENSFDLMLQ